MKFNWGIAITICIAMFMAFILYLVYLTTSTNKDLYAADYYEQEIAYQQKINALDKGSAYRNEIDLIVHENSVNIQIGEKLRDNCKELSVTFYRPNNSKLDKHYKLDLKKSNNFSTASDLQSGLYDVFIRWEIRSEKYLYQESIQLK